MRRREHLALGPVLGVAIALVLLVVVLVACVAVFPSVLIGPDVGSNTLSLLDRLKTENDVRLTLLQGLGGLLALLGVALGAAATLRQIRVNRESNTIGLFTKAIDQLSEAVSRFDTAAFMRWRCWPGWIRDTGDTFTPC